MRSQLTLPNGSHRRRLLAFTTVLAAAALALALWSILGARPAAGSGNTIAEPDGGVDPSLAIDNSGHPVVSYQESNSLKLLRCGNATCTSGNTFAIPDAVNGDQGLAPSLALDSTGRAVVSYTGNGTFGQFSLKVLHCVNLACGSASNSIVALDEGRSSSLALDASGFPVVSFDSAGMLKVVHCGDANCSSGNISASIESTASSARSTSLKLDGLGRPVVGYVDSGHNLRVLRCGDANCMSGNTTSSLATVGTFGGLVRLVLDTAGYPALTYYDDTDGHLNLARCDDAICSSKTITNLDHEHSELASLALDGLGKPVIAYVKWGFHFQVLHCGDANCTSGNVMSAPVAEEAGFQDDLALDSLGHPVVGYQNAVSDGIRVLHCGDANCGAVAKPTPTPTFTPTPSLPTPTPCSPCPLNFSISADVNNDGKDDCDTRGGGSICTLTAGDSFRVRLNLDYLPSGPTYEAWEGRFGWSGALSYIVGSLRGGGEYLVGSTVSSTDGTPSIGPLFSSRLVCTEGQNNSVSIVNNETAVFNGGTHYESASPGDTLTIRCPRTEYSQPMTVAGGGTLNTDLGDSLSVPPNSIAADTKITLSIGVPTDAAPTGLVALLRTYNFQPTGLPFSTDAAAVFTYDGLDLGSANPSSLQVYTLNPSTHVWELIAGSSVNTGNKTVAVSLSHFSTYALLRDGTVDTDGDGCPDAREAGPNQLAGGRRDWNNAYDYFNPSGDGQNRIDDVLDVVHQFFKDSGNPAYNPDTDRTLLGPNAWNLGPPDGQQRVDDILHSVHQFFHDCS